jgi:hypothetical protein
VKAILNPREMDMAPQWFGWCYAPDFMEEADVEGFGRGRYYDSGSQVGDLGRFQVQSGHVTIVRDRPDSMHITWQLIALKEDGTPFNVPPEGYHVKLYHWYNIAPDGSSVSYNSGNWDNLVDLAELNGRLRDDVVDADSELKPYSDELAESFAAYLDQAWAAGSTGTPQQDVV